MISKSFFTLSILVVTYIHTANSTGTCPCASPPPSNTCNPPAVPTDPSKDPRNQNFCYESNTVYNSVISTPNDMENHLVNPASPFYNWTLALDPFVCEGLTVSISGYKNACKRWEAIHEFRLVSNCVGCTNCKDCALDNRRCVCDPVLHQVRLANNGRVAANLICKKQNGYYQTNTPETDLYIQPDLTCCTPLNGQQNTWVENKKCC